MLDQSTLFKTNKAFIIVRLKTTHEPTVDKKFTMGGIVVSCRVKVERSFARIAMNAIV